MNNEIVCLLCGESSSGLKHEAYPGYQESMIFQIFHCENCNTSFSLPRFNDTKHIYDKIYSNISKIPGYDRYWKYYRTVKNYKDPLKYLVRTEGTYWGVNKALQQIVQNKESVKVLEVGSGLGYLTYALNKAGYSTTGLDISETAVKQANGNYGNYYVCDDLFNYSEIKSNSFNVVILTEVIEHINEPFNFISQLLNLLEKGGYVILTTPNKSCYPPEIIWDTESPPVHSWWFSELSISYITNKLNAKVDFIDFTDFYKDRYAICDLELLRNNPLRKPILDENGDVKKLNKQFKPLILIALKRLICQVPYLIRAYKYLLNKFNSNILIFEKRGYIMCAIIEKV